MKNLLLLFAALVCVGCGQNSESVAKAQAEKAALDSMTKASGERYERARVRHDSLMKHDRRYAKRYNDSIKQAEQAALDLLRMESPKDYIDVTIDWHTGGFGSVALGKIKIDNKSLKDCVNPTIAVTFFANGEAVNVKAEKIFKTFRAGKKQSSDEINFGFVNAQVNTARAEFVDATWE